MIELCTCSLSNACFNTWRKTALSSLSLQAVPLVLLYSIYSPMCRPILIDPLFLCLHLCQAKRGGGAELGPPWQCKRSLSLSQLGPNMSFEQVSSHSFWKLLFCPKFMFWRINSFCHALLYGWYGDQGPRLAEKGHTVTTNVSPTTSNCSIEIWWPFPCQLFLLTLTDALGS